MVLTSSGLLYNLGTVYAAILRRVLVVTSGYGTWQNSERQGPAGGGSPYCQPRLRTSGGRSPSSGLARGVSSCSKSVRRLRRQTTRCGCLLIKQNDGRRHRQLLSEVVAEGRPFHRSVQSCLSRLGPGSSGRGRPAKLRMRYLVK